MCIVSSNVFSFPVACEHKIVSFVGYLLCVDYINGVAHDEITLDDVFPHCHVELSA